MLLSLLFYGYATGVFSSRKLEKATYDSVAFRFITADSHPDHDTIAAFRKRFLTELEALFVQLLIVADTVGMLKLGTVSLDGTKIKANASKHKALSWGHAVKLEEQLRREVQELLRRAEEADAEDDPELDIPEELARREDRLAAIEKAKAEMDGYSSIELRAHARFEAEQAAHEEKLARRAAREAATGRKARGRAPKPPVEGPRKKDQVNLTDAESRIMPSSEGFVQAYNAQAAVDTESHLIVENHITQQPNDKQELITTVERLAVLEQRLGRVKALLADAGYFSRSNVEYCATEQITPYISACRTRHNLPLAERRPAADNAADAVDVADAVEAMARRLKTREGRALYARRKATVEPVFGIIKHVLGFRRFHLRGLAAVQGEWNLVCMAWNLKRMHVLAR